MIKHRDAAYCFFQLLGLWHAAIIWLLLFDDGFIAKDILFEHFCRQPNSDFTSAYSFAGYARKPNTSYYRLLHFRALR